MRFADVNTSDFEVSDSSGNNWLPWKRLQRMEFWSRNLTDKMLDVIDTQSIYSMHVWRSQTDVYIAGKIFLCTSIWCIICPDQLRSIQIMCQKGLQETQNVSLSQDNRLICRLLKRSSLRSTPSVYYTLSLAVSGQSHLGFGHRSHLISALARVTSGQALICVRCTQLYTVCHAINHVDNTLILLVAASLSLSLLEWLLLTCTTAINHHHHWHYYLLKAYSPVKAVVRVTQKLRCCQMLL